MATVYLIHLDKPLGHAKHYLGYTSLETVTERLERHRAGNGARLLQVANQRGITYSIVRTWEFERCQDAKSFERRMKLNSHVPRKCPVCNQAIVQLESIETEK